MNYSNIFSKKRRKCTCLPKSRTYTFDSIFKMNIIVVNNLERFYFLGSMGNRLSEGDMSLHYFKLNKDNKIKNYNIAQIGERIRDIKYDSKNNSLLMILENIPSLGIIYFN